MLNDLMSILITKMWREKVQKTIGPLYRYAFHHLQMAASKASSG